MAAGGAEGSGGESALRRPAALPRCARAFAPSSRRMRPPRCGAALCRANPRSALTWGRRQGHGALRQPDALAHFAMASSTPSNCAITLSGRVGPRDIRIAERQPRSPEARRRVPCRYRSRSPTMMATERSAARRTVSMRWRDRACRRRRCRARISLGSAWRDAERLQRNAREAFMLLVQTARRWPLPPACRRRFDAGKSCGRRRDGSHVIGGIAEQLSSRPGVMVRPCTAKPRCSKAASHADDSRAMRAGSPRTLPHQERLAS